MKKVFKTMAFTLLGLVLSSNLWAAVTAVSASGIESGKSYVIVATYDNNDYLLKPTTFSAKGSTAASFDASKVSASDAWLFTKSGDTWTIKLSTGEGLYFTNDNNGVACAENKGASFSIAATTAGAATSYLTASDGTNTRYLALYQGSNWRCYKNTSSGVPTIQLYSISTTPTPPSEDPSLSVSPATIDFGEVFVGGSVAAQNVTATLTNTDYAIATLSGTNANAFEITAGAELTETGTITVQPKAETLAAEGTYSATLEVEADDVDGTKTVSLSLKVVKPFTGNTWTLDKDDFTTGGYGSGTKTVDDIEISYADVYQNSSAIQFKKTSGVIYNTTDFGKIEKIEITKTGNNNLNVYPGTSSNPTENAILGVASDNVTTYTFPTDENYGYFAIGKGSGASNVTPIKVFYYPIKSDITIDNTCANGTVSVTSPSVLTQVASGTEITLSNTPASGYKLDAYKVYKTGDESTTVNVEDSKFKMPAYGVTVSATFETAKVLNDIDINTDDVKKEFWKGEAFTSENLVVTAHFSTGDETVEPTSVTGYNMNNVGDQTVTVAFKEGLTEKSKTYTINVKNTTNTKETAFTVAEAIDIIDKKLAPTTEVYVKGIVSQIDSYNDTYNSITYWISEDGTTTNQFEIYGGLKSNGEDKFTSKEDLKVGEYLVICGKIKDYKGTKEMDANNYIVERAQILQSIALSGEYPTEFSLNDPFSHEGQIVTASYNYGDPNEVQSSANCTWSGYDMGQVGTQEVTVTYIENSVEKTAMYNITITKPCTSPITITKGAEVNGTFELSKVGYFCLDDEEGNKVSTILMAEPAEHYHFASVTAEGCTIGAIEDNQCTISDIVADVTITANFVEDAKATATFVKGEEAATGDAPANIEEYVGEEITLPANTFAYVGHIFAGWSDGNNVYQANDKYTLTENTEFTATWNELPIWAYTYTSNVTLSTDGGTNAYKEAVKIRVDDELTQFDALRGAKSGGTGVVKVTVPAHTSALHFHMAGWKDVSGDVTIKKGEESLRVITLVADAGITSSSPYTLSSADPAADYYYNIPIADSETATDITFNSASSKRFVLFGVNAIQPAAISIDPAEKDFGEVKENETSDAFEFALTPNDFVEGTISAEIVGDGASAFDTDEEVVNNKVSVTFTPTAVQDYEATLNIKLGDVVMCSATLSGTGIAATTPTIDVDKENIDFGTKKQGESFESQTVAVTLNYLSAATVAVTGNFDVTPTSLTGSGNVTVSVKSTEDADTFDGELTISGEGASDKVVSLHAVVADKWATTYSSNISDINENLSYGVIVENVTYEKSGIKIGSSGKGGSATLKIPEGTKKLHFHVAAWKDKSTGLTVKMGEITLREIASTDIPSEEGVSGNGTTYTLVGNTSTDQYFNIDLSGYTIEENTEITFTTSGERVVLYGVNQEGGTANVLQSIEIQGTATALNYEIGQSFDPKGLKVVGTFKKGEEDPTSRDLTTAEFDWSFDPAQFNEENESASVTVTASAKENTAITANKTIENIVVIAPVVEISTTTTKVDFGTVAQNATVDNELVYVTFKNCTEASVALSGDGAAKFTIDADKVEAGETNWVTVGVAEGITATAGEYSATLTIHANGALADIVLPVTLIVEAPDNCDGTDDFDQDLSGTTATTYGNRNTTNGWTAVNTAIATIGVAPNTEKFFTINGKTSAVGVITSPELEGGLASLKIRYANTFQEANGVSFRVDIKQGEDVVKTYTITKANDDVAQNTVYTETISDINVAGKYQIVITNLSPSNNSSNKDRVSIGRLCITEYADFARDVEVGHMYTFCPEKDAESISGAEFYEAKAFDGSYVTFEEAENVQAGYGYLMVATEEKVQLVYADMDAITEAVSASAENGMQGVLKGNKTTDKDGFQFTETSYNHAVVVNNHLQYVGALNIIPVGRAYVNLSVISGQPTPAAPMHKCMRVGFGGQAPTDINGLNGNMKAAKVLRDGQLYIIRDTKTYNAQGIEVQ